jgi:transposase InsO family protein
VRVVWESEKESQQTLCRLLGYTRQAYQRRQRVRERAALEGELVIQEVLKIREVQKRIGGRKMYHMTQPFCSEHGIKIGRDAFFDLLREDSLLVARRRSRKPRTTISNRFRRYPNLIRDYVPNRPNEVWVSDITYVRLQKGFGFLSLITDAYSRMIVGYSLSHSLSTKGCVAALKMALRNNPKRHSLIHHSDRGTQYSSAEYVKLLGTSICISMTEKGDPLENAIAERVNGIIKEELLDKDLTSFREARESVGRAITIYNHQRPHSSVDYLTPAMAHTRTGELKRRWKNYFSIRPIAQAMA